MTVLPQPAPFSLQSTTNISSTGSSMPAFASRIPLPNPQSDDQTYPSSPPCIPEASHSASTSPASSVSPQTLPDAHGPAFCKVISADSSPIGAPVIPHSHGSGPILVAWLAPPLPLITPRASVCRS